MNRRIWLIGSLAAALGLAAVTSLHGQQAPAPAGAAPLPFDPNAVLTIATKSPATGAAILQPSVITIHAHSQPLGDTLADLANQCGADLGIVGSTEINDSRLRKVTLDVDKGSFWDVMIPLCKAAEIGPAPGPGAQRMLIVDRPTGLGGGASLSAQSNGILFIPQFAHIERLVNYDDLTRDQATLTVQILMIPEPKMRLVGGVLDNWLDTCKDDKGNSLASPIARSSSGQISQSWGTLSANLLDLPEQGTRIESIKGKVRLAVRTQSQVLSIDNIMKNKAPQVSGNNSVQIMSASSNPDMDTIKVSVIEEGASTPALGQSRAVPEGITFLDSSGAMIPYSGANAGGGNGSTTVTYAFITGTGANARHPATLRWELTTQSKTIDVPFELHGLELPIARAPKPAN